MARQRESLVQRRQVAKQDECWLDFVRAMRWCARRVENYFGSRIPRWKAAANFSDSG
jgi:hypothetical protein